MKNIKVRFAPSPTGFLHIGGLRTALYNYLFAKQNNGKIVLRIEDTDQKRIVKGATDSLINIFNKFNIIFDEGPQSNNGDFYFQSNRLNIYKKYSNNLLKSGHAYKSFLNPDELADLRKETEKLNQSTQYFRNKIREHEKNHQENNNYYVIRLKVPDNEEIIFIDQIRGEVKFNTNEIDDQVLIKADGFPTYHLANVIDDYEMGITHVIRGEEWLSSTPKHILIYNALGFDCPMFSHLPLLLNSDKTKLSKRQGDVAVEDFIDKGYLADAIINFIALLGWHPENDNEILSSNDLIRLFSLDRVQKGGAVFDINKLNWINSQYIKKLSSEDLIKLSNKFLPDYIISPLNKNKNKKIFNILRDRIKTLSELKNEIEIFYNKPQFSNEDIMVLIEKKNLSIFNYWTEYLLTIDTINEDTISNLLKQTEENFGISGKMLFSPIRLALYGNEKGPSIPSICNILEKEEVINRLNNAIMQS